jgi:hypothetical protein
MEFFKKYIVAELLLLNAVLALVQGKKMEAFAWTVGAVLGLLNARILSDMQDINKSLDGLISGFRKE